MLSCFVDVQSIFYVWFISQLAELCFLEHVCGGCIYWYAYSMSQLLSDGIDIDHIMTLVLTQ